MVLSKVVAAVVSGVAVGVDVEVDSGVAVAVGVASGVGVDVYSVDSDVGSGVDVCWPNAVAPRITAPRAKASVMMRGGPINLKDNLMRLMTLLLLVI